MISAATFFIAIIGRLRSLARNIRSLLDTNVVPEPIKSRLFGRALRALEEHDGSSCFLGAVLQRILCDVEVVKSHTMFDWYRVAELHGPAHLIWTVLVVDRSMIQCV